MEVPEVKINLQINLLGLHSGTVLIITHRDSAYVKDIHFVGLRSYDHGPYTELNFLNSPGSLATEVRLIVFYQCKSAKSGIWHS
jgi:hypothetical protein